MDAFDDVAALVLGLNRTDLRCLDWLFEGAWTTGELAERTGLSSAATTTLIDRLEEKGFVRRIRDASDRRRVVVEITPRGRLEVGRTYGPLAAEGDDLLAEYTMEEIALITRYLEGSRTLVDAHRKSLESSRR